MTRKQVAIAMTCAARTLRRDASFFVGDGGSDSNDGLSASRPFATLARALRSMRGGETIYLMPGHAE